MLCPTCSEPARVINSRLRDSRTWRRHKCPNGHRFSTVEILESERPTAAGLTETEINRLVARAVARLLPDLITNLVAELSKPTA